MRKEMLPALAALFLLYTLAAYVHGRHGGSGASGPDAMPSSSAAEEKVTLTFFTALADRQNGPGKVEQAIIDQYMRENPGVRIRVEALQDEAYKAKMKIYASTNQMPDVIQSWGQPSFIKPLIDNGLLLELDPSDFAESGFFPGAMDGFSQDHKVYGLPRSADFLVLFYNKRIFQEKGLQVPQTVEDLNEVVRKLRGAGMNPIAVNGMDRWTFPIWFEYMQERVSGSFDRMDAALSRRERFSNPVFVEAAENMQAFAQNGAFADDYLTASYGAARNLFGQGGAAMYLTGSWETGLATDGTFSADFRENVGAFPYPGSQAGGVTDVAAWYGGGYSISASTEHPGEALRFLHYFFRPENWARLLWKNGAGMPSSRFSLSGSETGLQRDLAAILDGMTSYSGTPVLDASTDKWKTGIMELEVRLLDGRLSPQQFVEELDKAADEASEEQRDKGSKSEGVPKAGYR